MPGQKLRMSLVFQSLSPPISKLTWFKLSHPSREACCKHRRQYCDAVFCFCFLDLFFLVFDDFIPSETRMGLKLDDSDQ